MKKIATMAAAGLLAASAGIATANSAAAFVYGDVTVHNQVASNYVTATKCAPWGSCTIANVAFNTGYPGTQCFRPYTNVVSQWGGYYASGKIYCFQSSASGHFYLYVAN